MTTLPNRYEIYLDIAGAVTEQTDRQEYLTVGGVALLPETSDAVRKALSQDFPKWKDASLPDALRVAELIGGMVISALTLRVNKETPVWESFWRDGRAYHRSIAQATRGEGSFVKAANVVRYWLFGECAARIMGESVRRVGWPTLTDINGRSIVDLRIICDTDIQGEENIETFRYLWEVLEERQHHLARLNLVVNTRAVALETEQDEPLLLLADHVAGAVHAYSMPRVVDRPVGISEQDLDEIQRMHDQLPNLVRIESEFDIPYRQIFGDTSLGRVLWAAEDTNP